MGVTAGARAEARITINELHLRLHELEEMTVGQLRAEYERVFDEPSASRNKRYLVKRIAHRIQEMEHGGLSELAQRRIAELARHAPIRRRLLLLAPPPREPGQQAPVKASGTKPADREPVPKKVEALPAPPPRARDPRLPPVGAVIHKRFHELDYGVVVLADGFELAGERYRSLTAVARAITGSSWNGFMFFQRELVEAKGAQA